MGTSGSRTARIWRVLLRIAKWTFGTVFALVLLAIAINAVDEDLTGEAKALLVAPPNPYEPADNLYLALLGIEAPQGVSPIATGQARVAEYEKKVAAASKDPRYEFQDPTGDKVEKLAFQGKVNFCRPLQTSCVAGVEAHKADIERLLNANRVLHQRYLDLHRATGYYDMATPSLYVLIAYPPQPVRQLYLANIALQAKTGTPRQQSAGASRPR